MASTMASLGQDMDKLLPAGGSTMPALVVATLEQVLASLDVAKLEGGYTMEASLEQVLASLDVAKLEVLHFPRTNVIGIFP